MKATRIRHTAIRHTAGDYVFLAADWLILILFFLILAYPLLYVIASSFSAMQITTLSLIPKRISLEGYRAVIEYKYIWIGYVNSLLYMALGTAIALVVTICCAYPLSRPDFKAGKLLMGLCLFTMYFSGGIVPEYLNIQSMGLMDSLWALIIPVSINTYNLLIMRSAFASVPDSLVEAAKLDGASHARILTQVFLPLSGATLAVMVLYYAVGHWNAWFRASLYIHDTRRYPLQLVLRQILLLNQNAELAATSDAGELAKYADSIKYALIVISCAPILVLYPFLQRFFAKGVMVGALKG